MKLHLKYRDNRKIKIIHNVRAFFFVSIEVFSIVVLPYANSCNYIVYVFLTRRAFSNIDVISFYRRRQLIVVIEIGTIAGYGDKRDIWPNNVPRITSSSLRKKKQSPGIQFLSRPQKRKSQGGVGLGSGKNWPPPKKKQKTEIQKHLESFLQA